MNIKEQVKNLMLDIVSNKTAMFAKDKAQFAEDAVRGKLSELFGTDKLTYNVWEEKKWQVFSIISEVLNVSVPNGIIKNAFYDTLAEFKNGAEGEQNEFVLNSDSLVYTASISGSHWNIDRQKFLGKRSFVVPTKWIGVRIYEELDRVMKGTTTIAEMFAAIQRALEIDINNRIYAAWGGADVYLPDEFKEAGTFSTDTMLGLVDRVQTATNKAMRIVGTRQGLSKMGWDSEWISDDMRNEKNRTGFIKYWEGVETIVLPQAFIRGTYDFAIDPNVLRVVPADYAPIKIFYEGQNRVRNLESTDSEDMTLDVQTQVKAGVSVVMPMLFGEYKIS